LLVHDTFTVHLPSLPLAESQCVLVYIKVELE